MMEMLKEMNAAKVRWPEILIFLYFMLKPFYINDFPMQIADFLLLALFGYCILHKRKDAISIHSHTGRAFFVWCLLTTYVCLVNFIWFLCLNCRLERYETNRLFMSSLYFIYNGIAIYTVLMLYSVFGKRLYRIFMYSAFSSVMLQIIMSVILYDSSVSRQIIAFSNPNQLGYYAIIMLTIGILWGEYLSLWQLRLFILGTLYLNFISLSKASIIAGVVSIAFCIIPFSPIVILSVIPAKISKSITVMTSATNVIPLLFFSLFIFHASFILFIISLFYFRNNKTTIFF